MALPTHLLESLQLRILEDITERLEDLPKRMADGDAHRGAGSRAQGRPAEGDQKGSGEKATAAPGHWQTATERLLGAAGNFSPGLGEIAHFIRSIREFHDALRNFLNPFLNPGEKAERPLPFIPRAKPPKAARNLPIPGAPPIRVYPRPAPWATEGEMLRGSRGLVPHVIDQQGNPVLPRTPLPGPSVPLLEDRRGAASASASNTIAAAPPIPPIIPPGVPPPGSAPERTTSLPPGGPDPFAEWRRALNVDLNDPDAYEVDINTGELTLPGQDTPPLTGAAHGTSQTSDEQIVALLKENLEVNKQIVRAMEEEEANEDGGTPSSAEREQGPRRSAWDSDTVEPRSGIMPGASGGEHKTAGFPGRPLSKPKGAGLAEKAVGWLMERLI